MSYYRKVIRIRAEDSPNVRRALLQKQAGIEPTGDVVTAGVLSWADYCYRRSTWDKVRQCIGLDGQFYEGAELMLFPPEWLNNSERLAFGLKGVKRQAKAIGIDPAEGGDATVMVAVDELGVIELISERTPDTSKITGAVIAFGRKHGVDPSNWVFDRGGGGKQHSDRLKSQGMPSRTVAFGETLALDLKRGLTRIEDKKEMKEERYVYVNRRAQMYHEMSLRCDPANEHGGFAIPAEYQELRRQLAVMPNRTDEEGRYWLPPKNKKDPTSDKQTLTEMLGCSPDEADALVLAHFGMIHKVKRVTAGAI